LTNAKNFGLIIRWRAGINAKDRLPDLRGATPDRLPGTGWNREGDSPSGKSILGRPQTEEIKFSLYNLKRKIA